MTLSVNALPARISGLHDWRSLLLAALVATTLIGLISTVLYQHARRDTLANLEVIVKLKAAEVERWMGDKRSSMIQPTGGLLATALDQWEHSSRDAKATSALRDKLAFYLLRHPEASRIAIYDARETFIVSTDVEWASTGEPALIAPPDHTQAALIDFYLDKNARPRLAFTSSLRMAKAIDAPQSGYVLLELDPEKYLYPFIQSWPSAQGSASADVMLYRHADTQIEYLSPLRREGIAPLSRRPVSPDEALPSTAQRETGHTSFGYDTRGNRILRATQAIAGANWMIAARMPTRDVLGPALRNGAIIGGVLMALLLALFRLYQLSHQRSLVAARSEQQAQDMALLRAFIDAVPETLYMVRRDGTLAIINRTGAQRMGNTQEALIGTEIFAHLPPEIAAKRWAVMEQAWRSGKTSVSDDSRNGTDYESRICPLPDGQHLAIVATDVTQRNIDARALKESAQTLQRFIDHLPGLAYVKDNETRVRVANKKFATILGVAPETMIGRLTRDIFPGPVGEQFTADDLRVLRTGITETIEEAVGDRHYESTKFVIPHEYGPPDLGRVTVDITTRHQAEQALRQSEERLRNLGDNLPDSFIYQLIIRDDGQREFLYLSSGIERILGIPPETALRDPSSIYGLVDASRVQAVLATEQDCLKAMQDFSLEVPVRHTDGHSLWLRLRSRPHRDVAGQVIWDGIATDVTATHEAEEILSGQAARANVLLDLPRQAEKLAEPAFIAHAFRMAAELTESHRAFVHFVDNDAQRLALVAYANTAAPTPLVAPAPQYFCPLQDAGFLTPVAHNRQPVRINQSIAPDEMAALPPGTPVPARVLCVPIVEEEQVRMVATLADKPGDYTMLDVETLVLIANQAWRIARKQRAERLLEHTRQVVEASPAVCFRWLNTQGWPVVFVSDNLRRWGYEPAALLSGERCFASLIHPDDLGRVSREVAAYVAEHQTQYVQEYRLIAPDGHAFWVSDASTVIYDADGTVRFVDGVLADISERKAQEIRLAEQLQAEQALNKRLEEAHSQLLQSEKLAAIGQLAAGIAHELNNPIGFVHSNLGTLTEYVTALVELCDTYTTLIEDQFPECAQITDIQRIKESQDYNFLRADVFPLLEESREGLIRVRKIVQDLRDFSRPGNQEWGMADLHKGLNSTLNIAANELRYKCTIRKEYGDIPEVYCVISQINQVFMNLLVNAAQAIESSGEITLRTGMEDAHHVWISICDTGEGIRPENINRIFEPFFTTKPVGIGTGLGLSLVFSIITRHNGRIEVESEPGRGTCFRITLPIEHTDEAATTPPLLQEAS